MLNESIQCSAGELAPGGPETIRRNIFQCALRSHSKRSITEVINARGSLQETLYSMCSILYKASQDADTSVVPDTCEAEAGGSLKPGQHSDPPSPANKRKQDLESR